MHCKQHQSQKGYTMVELLMAMAIGALVVGAAAVSFGTFTRAQPLAGNSVRVVLDATRMAAYYGLSQNTVEAVVAPNYGSVARAETLRERFIEDTMSGTAVFCLARNRPNTYHPHEIPFDPAVDNATGALFLDLPETFRAFLVARTAVTGVTAASFLSVRNHQPLPVPSTATSTAGAEYTSGASIFVLGYSSKPNALAVTAVYDIDIDKVSTPAGFYASVKRWASSASTGPKLTDYYDVFYPPSRPATWPATTDQFAPFYVTFERSTRLARVETTAIDRFKVAKEQPFYFVWWPDPAARTLDTSRSSGGSFDPRDPREAYSHMLGRTAFMFTVPMFPATSS